MRPLEYVEGVWRVFGRHIEVVWMVFGECMQGIMMVLDTIIMVSRW